MERQIIRFILNEEGEIKVKIDNSFLEHFNLDLSVIEPKIREVVEYIYDSCIKEAE